jgi:hypothetical protein
MSSSRLSFASTRVSRGCLMPPQCPSWTPSGVWGPNQRNHLLVSLRPKSPNPLKNHISYAYFTISTWVTIRSLSPLAHPFQPSSWLVQHDILLHIYICLWKSSSVNHPQSISRPSWSFCLPHVCPSSLPIYWHDIMHTNIAGRYIAEILTLGLISNSIEAWLFYDNHQTFWPCVCMNKGKKHGDPYTHLMVIDGGQTPMSVGSL